MSHLCMQASAVLSALRAALHQAIEAAKERAARTDEDPMMEPVVQALLEAVVLAEASEDAAKAVDDKVVKVRQLASEGSLQSTRPKRAINPTKPLHSIIDRG